MEYRYKGTMNLNRVIDNYYPTDEGRPSNLKHRPIGLGIQGLTDTLIRMKINFDSDEAVEFNSIMIEAFIVLLTASMETAKVNNKTYETFKGSPLSEGKFQSIYGMLYLKEMIGNN